MSDDPPRDGPFDSDEVKKKIEEAEIRHNEEAARREQERLAREQRERERLERERREREE